MYPLARGRDRGPRLGLREPEPGEREPRLGLHHRAARRHTPGGMIRGVIAPSSAFVGGATCLRLRRSRGLHTASEPELQLVGAVPVITSNPA